MQFGAVYPQSELSGTADTARRIGDLLDRVGFHHVLAYDHVLGAVRPGRTPPLDGPYDETNPFHDPLVLFAYLAGRHERLRFATGVLVLPQRQTVLVARQAADLAILSGGRFRLGVGVGWNAVEYQALGQGFESRGARLEEQIDLLRQLWSAPSMSFDGRFDTIDRAALVPRPADPVPVWMGGFGEASIRRAARLCDGFTFTGASGSSGAFDPDATLGRWDAVRAAVADHGRDVEEFGGELIIRRHRDPRDAVRAARWWADNGGTHVAVATLGLGLDSTEAHLDYLAAVAESAGDLMGVN